MSEQSRKEKKSGLLTGIESIADQTASQASDDADAATGLEIKKLGQQKAKPASVQAEESRTELLQHLCGEKQKSLDDCEKLRDKIEANQVEAIRLHSRVSELEQSERTSKAAAGVAGLTNVLGATLLGCAGFATTDIQKYGLLGSGIAFSAVSVFENLSLWQFIWPPKRKP